MSNPGTSGSLAPVPAPTADLAKARRWFGAPGDETRLDLFICALPGDRVEVEGTGTEATRALRAQLGA